MYLPVFLVLLLCMCVLCLTVCTGRQTDTVERLVKQYQHTRARAYVQRSFAHP